MLPAYYPQLQISAVIFGDEFALLGWVFALPRWASGEFNPDRGLKFKRSCHDLSPSGVGARHRAGGGRRLGPCSCRSIGAAGSTGQMFDQHPKKAGPGSLRSAQRRGQLSAWVPLPPTTRAVPERCCRLVWRRARPWSHAPGRCTSDESDQSDEPNKSDEPDESNQACEPKRDTSPSSPSSPTPSPSSPTPGTHPLGLCFTDRRLFVTMHQ